MGLDMHVSRTVAESTWSEKNPQTCDGIAIPFNGDGRGSMREQKDRIGYFRKFNALHGYIVDEFAGGEDNCQEIGLDRESVDKIIEALEQAEADPASEMNPLQPRSGFFFGSTEIDEYYLADVKQALALFRWIAGLMESEEGRQFVMDDDGTRWITYSYQASW